MASSSAAHDGTAHNGSMPPPPDRSSLDGQPAAMQWTKYCPESSERWCHLTDGVSDKHCRHCGARNPNVLERTPTPRLSTLDQISPGRAVDSIESTDSTPTRKSYQTGSMSSWTSSTSSAPEQRRSSNAIDQLRGRYMAHTARRQVGPHAGSAPPASLLQNSGPGRLQQPADLGHIMLFVVVKEQIATERTEGAAHRLRAVATWVDNITSSSFAEKPEEESLVDFVLKRSTTARVAAIVDSEQRAAHWPTYHRHFAVAARGGPSAPSELIPSQLEGKTLRAATQFLLMSQSGISTATRSLRRRLDIVVQSWDPSLRHTSESPGPVGASPSRSVSLTTSLRRHDRSPAFTPEHMDTVPDEDRPEMVIHAGRLGSACLTPMCPRGSDLRRPFSGSSWELGDVLEAYQRCRHMPRLPPGASIAVSEPVLSHDGLLVMPGIRTNAKTVDDAPDAAGGANTATSAAPRQPHGGRRRGAGRPPGSTNKRKRICVPPSDRRLRSVRGLDEAQ